MESTTFMAAKAENKFNWLVLLGRRTVNVAWLLKAILFLLAIAIITLFWANTLVQTPQLVRSPAPQTTLSPNGIPVSAAAVDVIHNKPVSSPQAVVAATTPLPVATKTTATVTTTVKPAPTTDKYAIFRTKPKMPTGRDCYKSDHVDRELVDLFDDVLTADVRPVNGTNIFFHETRCQNGTAVLNVRQACAVESAARTNPNTNVFLMYASPSGFNRNQERPAVFQALAAYPNVHLRNLDLWTYTEHTPAEKWMRGTALFNSSYLTVHTSDLMRLVSCFKWGGTYMDLDFVVQKSFESLPQNYAAEEIDGFIANGLINFEQKGLGHLIIGHLVKEFVDNYNGRIFAANGPALLKRVFQELCKMTNLLKCKLLTIHPKTTFYAVYGTVWERLFQPKFANESMVAVKDSMAVHMWNAITGGVKVKMGENSAYEQLAREFCPNVFATIEGDTF